MLATGEAYFSNTRDDSKQHDPEARVKTVINDVEESLAEIRDKINIMRDQDHKNAIYVYTAY